MKKTITDGTNKKGTKQPKVKRVLLIVAVYIAIVSLLTFCGLTAMASSDPLQVVNNLSTFIFSLIRALGLILLGFGIVQIGLSLKSHDPSQRANVRLVRVQL